MRDTQPVPSGVCGLCFHADAEHLPLRPYRRIDATKNGPLYACNGYTGIVTPAASWVTGPRKRAQ